MNNSVEAMVKQCFFELSWIDDECLRNQCSSVFAEAISRGGWTSDTAGTVPVSIMRVKSPELNNLFDHIHVVTKIAVSIYDSLEDNYKKDSKIRDIVVAGALLHDVGKMVEFSISAEGKTAYSKNAEIMRHPLSGAILAAEAGVCDEVVHVIATHSFEGEASHRSLAAKIVKAADDIAFSYITAFNDWAF